MNSGEKTLGKRGRNERESGMREGVFGSLPNSGPSTCVDVGSSHKDDRAEMGGAVI